MLDRAIFRHSYLQNQMCVLHQIPAVDRNTYTPLAFQNVVINLVSWKHWLEMLERPKTAVSDETFHYSDVASGELE